MSSKTFAASFCFNQIKIELNVETEYFVVFIYNVLATNDLAGRC
jgi:hypothetical protein